MISLENVDVIFAKGKALKNKVLNGLCLRVERGEFLVILGVNGSGKSTMLNVITGEVAKDKGRVLIDGCSSDKMNRLDRAKMIARVGQDPALGTIGTLTMLENLSFALRRGDARGLSRYDTNARRAIFAEKLSMLGIGLEERLDDLVDDLSGGQRQALSLVMALLHKAKVLLLDEITAALDPGMARKVMQITATMVEESNTTTLMITHSTSQAIEYGGRVVIIGEGRVLREFGPEEKASLTSSMLEEALGV